MEQVIQLARLCNYRVAHFRPALTRSGHWMTPVQADGSGFPDLVLVRPPRGPIPGKVLFVEVKTDRGRVTRDQNFWALDLLAAGAEYHVWRPSMMPLIIKILRGEEEAS